MQLVLLRPTRYMTFLSVCLCLLVGFVSPAASAAANDKNIATTELSAAELKACLTARCLIDLAKREGKDYKTRFAKNAEKEPVVRSLIYMGNDEEALDILEKFQRPGSARDLYYSYGWWLEGYVDQFLADGQVWEKFSPPLPESLIGRYYFFDMLFAYDAIEKKNFDVANDIAENIGNTALSNAIYDKLAIVLLEKDRIQDALAYMVKIQQSGGQTKGPLIQVIEIFRRATEQQFSISESFATNNILDENAQAGIAVALAESGHIDDALGKLAAIKDPEIRVGGFGYLLYMLAKQGEIDTVKELLDSHAGRNLTAGQYEYVVSGFLRSNDVANAEELISLPPTDDKAIFALSAIGAYTRDYSYFTRAFALLGQQPVWRHKAMPILVLDMAKAGYFSDAVKALYKIEDSKKRAKTSHALYGAYFKKPRSPEMTDEVLDAIEQDLKESDPKHVKSIVRIASRFLYVDQTTPEQLERYLKMVNMLADQEDREKLAAAVIPNLVHLGQTDKAIEILTDIDFILNRVWALTRLADYYSFKKMQDSI